LDALPAEASVPALDAAREYVRRGWRVVPVPYKRKKAVFDDWTNLRLTETDLPEYFDQPANIGLILGEPSGWLVDVDLDCAEAVALAPEYLPATQLVSGRPTKPRSHWWYIATGTETVKHLDPITRRMIVELRSTGAQTVVGPSIHPDDRDHYEIPRGEPAIVSAPMLTACVAALAKRVVELRYGADMPKPKEPKFSAPCAERRRDLTPQEIERRALAYLAKMPPAISGQGGHPATYAAATALVYGFELEPDHALAILLESYNPRCEPEWTEKELRHKVEDAATKPHDRPRGWLLADREPAVEPEGVDISALVAQTAAVIRPVEPVKEQGNPVAIIDAEPGGHDPGPVPDELLSIPGFVDELTAFTMATAPHPNRPLAFVGALTLLAALTGRKVREPGNLRTNVQILALAHSGVGKDWPRKINARVLMLIGESRKLGGKSASFEGIEDRLARHPILLKQDDEIDALLSNMQDDKETRYRNQLSMLLELFSEASGWRSVRDKAERGESMIHQPHLVLFGTTTPGDFYQSLSAKMLTKGLLARITAIEAGERAPRQRPQWIDPPASIMDVARWWAEFRPPGWGNLSGESTGEACPIVVPIDDEALGLIDAFAEECDGFYRAGAKTANEAVMSIWARAVEKATQLALVYACSVQSESPVIDAASIRWASAFTRHTVLRTIYMLGQHFRESDFEGNCNAMHAKLVAWTKEQGAEAWMPHRVLRKRLKRLDARQFEEAWKANEELGRLEMRRSLNGGRPTVEYRALVS
jgi:hypothetical protein